MNKPGTALKLSLFLWIYGLLISIPSLQAQKQNSLAKHDSAFSVQILKDSLFHSPQSIYMTLFDKGEWDKYKMDVASHSSKLKPTSRFAQESHAMVAINGSFFDMDRGGSVTYLEKGDSVISHSRPDTLKWAVPDSLANGAIVLSPELGLIISKAREDQYYEKSTGEIFVLVSGPLLISRSLPQKLPDMGFAHKRHPRSCLGITEESLIFMTVDGRSEQAAGMSLFELQEFLIDLGCTDAINLDGGGSTTLWTNSLGVVNMPSDGSGERSVANAIVISKL